MTVARAVRSRPSRHRSRSRRIRWRDLPWRARNDIRVLVGFFTTRQYAVRFRSKLYLAVMLPGLTACALTLGITGWGRLLARGYLTSGSTGVMLGILTVLTTVPFFGLPLLWVHQGADHVRAICGGPMYCVDCGREVTAVRLRHRCRTHRRGRDHGKDGGVMRWFRRRMRGLGDTPTREHGPGLFDTRGHGGFGRFDTDPRERDVDSRGDDEREDREDRRGER